MGNYDTDAVSATLRIRLGNGGAIQTREALIREVHTHLLVEALVAIYKCEEGREWCLSFNNNDVVNRHGDTTIETSTGKIIILE